MDLDVDVVVFVVCGFGAFAFRCRGLVRLEDECVWVGRKGVGNMVEKRTQKMKKRNPSGLVVGSGKWGDGGRNNIPPGATPVWSRW